MEPEAHELIAGYALDALDADDHAQAEELLRTSPEAREELRAFSDAVGGLALAATGPEPRPELRARILDAARTEAPNVVSLESRRRVAPALGAAAAIAAAVAVGLGFYALSLSGDLDDARTALERQEEAAAVLADPAARTVALRAGEGRLVVSPAGNAVLVVDGLAPAPSGKTYQLWVVEKGAAPTPAGLFAGSGGRQVVPVGKSVPKTAVVAVTLERAGGVDQPTTEPVLASAPA